MATQNELAAYLDLSQQAVSKLKTAGVLPSPTGRGSYDLDVSRVAYIRHLRAGAAGRGGGRDDSLEAQRARLAAAQAEAQERKNAHDRGELVRLADVMGPMNEAAAHVAQHLDRVSAIVAGSDLKLRRRIETALNDARELMCDPNGFPAALRLPEDEEEDEG